MANKVTSVKFKELSDRFEPKYYIFKEKYKVAKEKFKFVPLGDLGEKIARGQSPKPSTYKKRGDGIHYFIRTADLKRNILNFQTITYLSESTFNTQKSNRITADDLLISVVGNYLGSTVVIPKDIKEAAFNDNSARVRINSNLVSPYWVSAFLNSKFGHELIHASVTRTGQKILSAGNVKKLEIPVLQQEPFTNKLESCIHNMQRAQKIIYQAFDLFSSYLDIPYFKPDYCYSSSLDYIAKGDLWIPKYSYPQYRNAISAVKERFETVLLDDIASINKGDEVGSEEYIGYLDKKKSDIPFIRTTDIVNYETDLYPDFYISESLIKEINQELKDREVLFTKDGKIGITGMVNKEDKNILSSGIARISLKHKGGKKELTPEYLFVALSNPVIGGYQAKQRTVIASTIPHLREERIKEFIIPILDKEKITKITDLIIEANEIKSNVKSELRTIKEEIDNIFEF